VKNSGRDEPVWVVIYTCMEAMLGISLHSYPYLKVAKMLSFLLSLMLSLQQNQKTRGWNQVLSGRGREGGRKVAQTMYTHMNKCKNNQVK
jgi:hypothetical protein